MDQSAGSMSRQLATKGTSSRAAACAITSLPRSLPQASTAPGANRRAIWAITSPQASGPKSESTGSVTTWTTAAP